MQLARRCAFVALFLLVAWPSAAVAKDRFQHPFPTDLLTVRDPAQRTDVRVSLPLPDCGVRPSDCADIEVLNALDGFNVQPRLSIPFAEPIDLASVSSDTVFLVQVSSGRRVGINQAVWEPATNTLHAESDELLRQSRRYVLVVTDGVRAADGGELDTSSFRRNLLTGGDDAAGRRYRIRLRLALIVSDVRLRHVVTASLFTTQSVTATSEQIRRQVDAATPEPATFAIGRDGERAVFPFGSVRGITIERHVNTVEFPFFLTFPRPFAAFPVFPGALGTLAFGRFASPDYRTPAGVIPAHGTEAGTPEPQAVSDIYFDLYLPAGEEPAGGWPVAIFGHGFGDSKQGAPIAVASTLAAHGVAMIAINVVGHGGGPRGRITVERIGEPPVTIPDGGRGIDQDGNGTIDSTEGVNAAPPAAIVGSRDGLRQTVVDLMQLVRVIEVGVDVDGDGSADLDPARISYGGQSFGGIYGTQFLALEPNVHQGVLNVPGGSIIEIARLSPSFRSLVGIGLISRAPSLYNAVPDRVLQNFVENIPLRDEPILVDTVPGASAIQEFIDRSEWAQNAANPVAYAPHLRARPLEDVGPKGVIVQFAKGDKTVPNPTTSALIRAGRLADRATYFRNDLAVAGVPGYTTTNPHTFLTNLGGAGAPFAVGAQVQMATFFATDGATTIDPDGDGMLFETPIAGPLPEELNFLP